MLAFLAPSVCASSSRSHTHFSPEKEKQEPDLFIKGLGSEEEEEAGLQECNKSSVHRQSAVLTDKLCVAGEFGMPSTLSDTELQRDGSGESPQPAKFWAGPLQGNYHRKKRGTRRVTRPASPLPDLVAVRSRLLTFRGRFDKDRASELAPSLLSLFPSAVKVARHAPFAAPIFDFNSRACVLLSRSPSSDPHRDGRTDASSDSCPNKLPGQWQQQQVPFN